MLMKVLLMLA